MKCEKCGAEILNLSVNFFNHDGSDSYLEVAPYLHENGAVVPELTPNWTGYELSEEEAMETIRCPYCGSFPFEHKEVQTYTAISGTTTETASRKITTATTMTGSARSSAMTLVSMSFQ